MIKPIKNESDYDVALERIDQLMDASKNTPEGDELEVLALLVEQYEASHYPIEAIRFRMEQFGLQDKDLVKYIGRSGRVSEILNYKRKLTLPMIRKLHAGLKIPTESLIKDYPVRSV